MWQFIRSRILPLIIFIGAAHGILVVGPKLIRASQDYTVVISNFQSNLSSVYLMVRMEGHTDDGRNVLNLTKMANVPGNTNKKIYFKLPGNLSSGNYKITIEGQRGFGFHKEVALVFLGKSISGLIQINKSVFKPGDTVKFRVIVLDAELKPPARVETIHVMIRDPQNNVVRKWPSGKLNTGVFESNLQIASTPMLGTWRISVQVHGEEIVSKSFEVKEYVLSSFDVEVTPSVIPLEKHQGLNLTIAANHHFRKPVKGLARLELYLEDDVLEQKKELVVNGSGQVQLRFRGRFQEDQRDVLVKTTFIEQNTNFTVVKESQVTVYRYVYQVELLKDIPYFRPGIPFKCALQFRYHDGTPAKGITGKVEVLDIEYEATATSDDEGLIKLELHPTSHIEEMYISFSNDDEFRFDERVDKMDAETNAYIKLELKSPIKLNRVLHLLVTSNEPMTFFVYYVLSKGNIVESGFEKINKKIYHLLRLTPTEKMIPQAKIIVATVANDIVLYDYVDIEFDALHNDFDISIDKQEIKPGQQIELQLFGQPEAYVGLAAYDKDLLKYNKNHDLFWEDLMRVYNGFGPNVEHEFDKFHSMGLFVRTLDDIKFNEAHDMSARDGQQPNNPISKTSSFRTNFQESWLWRNMTIGRSGTLKVIESVPETTASWYLTGFSIDPVYGFGIIKRPIEFTTTQSFYIVDNLPFSIKRGEEVELQFTLFSNLEEDCMIYATLYNVDNQTEFIGRPLEDKSFTKSVIVPTKTVVPVSFHIKARSIGEMTIRVEATIKTGKVMDALEKVIRVTPESLVVPKMETRIIFLEKFERHYFLVNLDSNPKADNGCNKIMLRLNPNLLPAVIDNLDNLLEVPSGSGESNMVRFVPNIMALDYLHAVGSKKQSLIDKATNLVRQGYRNQMHYRQPDGSFAVWQNVSGSVFLTAFVAKSMQTASKYISEVDTAMVEKAYDWLASKQHSSGRFDEVGSMIHKEMQGGLCDGISLTSYVVTALIENENAKVKHAVVIQKAMSYLSSQVDSINTAYDLSIATYALMLNGHSMKDKSLKMLLDKSTVTDNDTIRFWRTENSIETTAYALLSFVIAEKYLDGIRAMRWLAKQRFMQNRYSLTQSTFVGMNALTKLAEKISPSQNDFTVQLMYKKTLKTFHVNSQNINIIHVEDIPDDTNSMEINVAGVGSGLLEVMYQYSLNLVHFENRFKLDVRIQNTTSDYKLLLKVCASFIPTMYDRLSNMALIEVTFPSGYVLDQFLIRDLTYGNPIQIIETRYGATSVVIYYNNMNIMQNCFTVTAYKRGKVAMKRPAYVIAYDSVNPLWNAIEMYQVD